MSVTLKLGPNNRVIGFDRDDTRVIEGRTIRNLADLRAFCEQVLASVDEDKTFAKPLDLRLSETKMADGTVIHDLYVSEW